MLSCENLSFSFDGIHHFNFPSFACKKGETLLILGNSGAGKTTLLHLMALLLKPQKGSIMLNNKELVDLSAKEAAKIRATEIGIIYQKSHFVGSLSVEDNLLLANYLADKKISKEQARNLAKSLGFENLMQRKTHLLSGGEQQRVSIARALMNNPSVILADEPTSSLDDENCQLVIDLLENQAKKIGASLIIVTHDQRLKSRFDKTVLLQ